MICSPRELIQVCIMQFGHWEPNISAVIQRLARPGTCAVDVGANVGYDTLLMSKAIGLSGTVISFEALPSTFLALQRNLSLNQTENVEAKCMAISDTAGTLTMYPGKNHNSGTASVIAGKGSDTGVSIKALPLHEALTANELSRLEFVKIDVEGAEVKVMQGILNHFQNFPALQHILVEISSAEDEASWAAIWREMQDHGFIPYEVENDYSYSSYLKWRQPTPPKRIMSLPMTQTDVLFTKADASFLLSASTH